jgi:hypothetical protein
VFGDVLERARQAAGSSSAWTVKLAGGAFDGLVLGANALRRLPRPPERVAVWGTPGAAQWLAADDSVAPSYATHYVFDQMSTGRGGRLTFTYRPD